MQNEENYETAPDMIRVSGMTRNNSNLNDIYFKCDKLNNEHVYYKTKTNSKYIYWQRNAWYIGEMRNKLMALVSAEIFNPYLEDNVFWPTLSAKHWLIYDVEDKRYKEDENVLAQIEKKDSPDGIRIRGITGINKQINGIYNRVHQMSQGRSARRKHHNGHVYYHSQWNCKYIYWERGVWYISDILGKNTFNAYLEDDVEFPTCTTKQWIAYKENDKELNEHNDIVLERMEDADTAMFWDGVNWNSVVIPKSAGISPEISGYYYHFMEPKNGHPAYGKAHDYENEDPTIAYEDKKDTLPTKFIFWEYGVWYVSDMLDINTCNAYLKDDVEFPFMSTKQWLTYDNVKNEFNKNNNMVLEKGKQDCVII